MKDLQFGDLLPLAANPVGLMWEGLRLRSSNRHLPVLDLTPSTATQVQFIRQEALRGKAEE